MKLIAMLLITAVMGLTSACGTDVSNFSCIPLVQYSEESQTQVLQELNSLGEGSEVRRYMDDYGELRSRTRPFCKEE